LIIDHTEWLQLFTNTSTHAHTILMVILPGKSVSAPHDSWSPLIFILSILTGKAKTLLK